MAVPLSLHEGTAVVIKFRLAEQAVRACVCRAIVIYWTNNNNNIYLLQMGCHPVAVIILHVCPNTTNKFT
jgi:hypothetical protein